MVRLFLCGRFLIQSSRWRSLWKDCNYFDHFLEGIYKSCALRYPSGFLEIVLISQASSVSHLCFFFVCLFFCISSKMIESKQIKEAKLLTTPIGRQLNRRLFCSARQSRMLRRNNFILRIPDAACSAGSSCHQPIATDCRVSLVLNRPSC